MSKTFTPKQPAFAPIKDGETVRIKDTGGQERVRTMSIAGLIRDQKSPADGCPYDYHAA